MPYWTRGGKFFSDEAVHLIKRIKMMGISYCFVEVRMGKSSNWGRRLSAGRGLVTKEDVEYLRQLWQALSQLPKRKKPTHKHVGQQFYCYTEPFRPKYKPPKKAGKAATAPVR